MSTASQTARPMRWVRATVSRVSQSSRWEPFRWELTEAVWCPEWVADAEAVFPNALSADGAHVSRIMPVALFPDEGEGYYLNCSLAQPAWFVHWRLDPEQADAVPEIRDITLSYNEAGRLMDAQEMVESHPIDLDTAHWLTDFLSQHYQPEPKKRARPASFKSPKDRLEA